MQENLEKYTGRELIILSRFSILGENVRPWNFFLEELLSDPVAGSFVSAAFRSSWFIIGGRGVAEGTHTRTFHKTLTSSQSNASPQRGPLPVVVVMSRPHGPLGGGRALGRGPPPPPPPG